MIKHEISEYVEQFRTTETKLYQESLILANNLTFEALKFKAFAFLDLKFTIKLNQAFVIGFGCLKYYLKYLLSGCTS